MPEFVKNADELAKDAMEKINPQLVNPFKLIIEFLIDNPALARSSKAKKAPEFGSDKYIIEQAKKFSKGRELKKAGSMKTIPDEMVSLILNKYFGVTEENMERANEWHRLSMAAENIIGDVLERYVASVLEKEGWAWCSGSMVKAVDFVYRDNDRGWVPL